MSRKNPLMRAITLHFYQIDELGEGKPANPLDYKALYLAACAKPMNGQNTTTAETREVAPIMDALDAAEVDETIYLTESQWSNLKKRVALPIFLTNSRDTLIIEDDLLAAKEVEMAAVAKKPWPEDDLDGAEHVMDMAQQVRNENDRVTGKGGSDPIDQDKKPEDELDQRGNDLDGRN